MLPRPLIDFLRLSLDISVTCNLAVCVLTGSVFLEHALLVYSGWSTFGVRVTIEHIDNGLSKTYNVAH